MPSYTFKVDATHSYIATVEAANADIARDIALNGNYEDDEPDEYGIDFVELLDTDDPTVDIAKWNEQGSLYEGATPDDYERLQALEEAVASILADWETDVWTNDFNRWLENAMDWLKSHVNADVVKATLQQRQEESGE